MENKIVEIIIPHKACIILPGRLTKNTVMPRFRINASKRKYPKIIIISAIVAEITVDKMDEFFLTMKPAVYPIRNFIINVAGAYAGKDKNISARHDPNPPHIAPGRGPSKNAESNSTASPILIYPFGAGICIIIVATQTSAENIAASVNFFVFI